MTQSLRSRLRKELAVACLGFGVLAGVGQSQLFAQDVLAAPQVVQSHSAEHTALTQSVALNADGQLVGQVQILGAVSSRAASGMKVSLLTTDGQAVSTTLNDQGAFAFENVQPGVCAIFGQADGVIVCQSVRVFESDAQSKGTLELFAVAPASAEIEKVIFSGYKSTSVINSNSMLPGAPSGYEGTNGLVELSGDGVMQGRVWSVRGPVSGTIVTIYQNGMAVAKTTADAAGKFTTKLAPGAYSLVASGTGGVAAVGFKAQAINSSITKTKTPKNVKLVSLQGPECAPVLCVGLAPPPPMVATEVVTQPGVQTVDSAVVGSPVGGGYGGGYGGGSFGGGGGSGAGGGLGGIGGLAAVGGLVAVGIIAADKNKNSPTVAVSPSGQ